MSDACRFRWISILLPAGGAGLACAVPFRLAQASPRRHSSFDLVETGLVLSVFYLVAAAIWLRWRSDEIQLKGAFVSGLLLFATLMGFGPFLFAPQSQRGDMVEAGLVFTAFLRTVGVLLVSVLALAPASATRPAE